MVAQSCHNRNTGKEFVQMAEDTFGDIHDVLFFRGGRVPPVRCTVASPYDEIWFGLKLVHCLKSREDKCFGGVATVFARRSCTLSSGPLLLAVALVAEIGHISSLGVEVIQVEIGDVPEVAC